MVKVQRRTVMALALGLYWPTVFVLAHMRIPEVVRRARMSDKSVHYLMYMILTMLVWSVVRPYSRVCWRKAMVWKVLVLVILYAVLDELLQGFVPDRSPDLKDFAADVLGVCFGLIVLTFFSFWPSLLIGLGTTIYILAVFTRANVTRLLPVTATVFHMGTYALFTLLWMGYVHRFSKLRFGHRLWIPVSAGVPLALLGVTKLSTLLSNKSFEAWDMVAGGIGILGAVGVVSGITWLIRRRSRGVALPGTSD